MFVSSFLQIQKQTKDIMVASLCFEPIECSEHVRESLIQTEQTLPIEGPVDDPNQLHLLQQQAVRVERYTRALDMEDPHPTALFPSPSLQELLIL